MDFLTRLLEHIRNRPPESTESEQINHAPTEPLTEYVSKELPAGHVLHGYRIEETLSSGSSTITYLAEEVSTGRRVILKEQTPFSSWYRKSDTLDVVFMERSENDDALRKNFLHTAYLQATLDHPNIAKVYSIFFTHNTAYCALEFMEGYLLPDFVEQLRSRGMSIPEELLVEWIANTLKILEYLHQHELLHLAVTPENILTDGDGKTALIGFSNMSEGFKTPQIINFNYGFSPDEQDYGSSENMGPWTDLYSLGATLYYILTGNLLPSSSERKLFDPITPLGENPLLTAKYNEQLLRSIDRAISPAIEDRYQNAGEWTAERSWK